MRDSPDRAKMVSDQFKEGKTNFRQGLASTKLQLDPISGEGLGASPRHGPTRPRRARQKF